MSWEVIQEGSDKTIVEYDEDRDMYRVSFFDDDWHFLEDVMFDAYNPRKQGFWIDTDTFDANKIHIYQCSICQKEVADDYIHKHKYCLHCGADMSKNLSKVGFNQNPKKYNISQRLDRWR